MKLNIKNEIKNKINPGMIGLFFEDINYGLDGGLHAEMIENRSFEFYDAGGVKYNWHREYDGMYGWSVAGGEYAGTTSTAGTGGDESVSLKINTEKPLNNVNPHYLEIKAEKDNVSIKNKAYDGICMKAGMKYKVSLYARTENYAGNIYIDIVKNDGVEKVVSALLRKSNDTNESDVAANGWQRYEAELCSESAISYAEFRIRLDKAGVICIDFVSMKPEDAVYGVFRRDLADILKGMNPGFLRFPGGCVVEGNTIENMYRWKESVGAPEARRANWNRWAVHGNNVENGAHGKYSHYNQTLGVGYYEYFLLCEYIGAKALPVCNVGLACQYESLERFELEDGKFGEFIQDALDLIEFANGSADTKWGALRAQMGHSEPFGLELLGIGNEQWETKEARFFERYTLFEQAIHERYPEIKLIGSAGPDVTSEHYTDAWEFYRNKHAENTSEFAYAIDEHYYVKPEWLIKNNHFYDNYPRDVKVFAGEYAAHTDNGLQWAQKNCWEAALSEAAFMTGLERNSDVVIMASYAPLFARVGYTQWAPDLIWFDAERAYGSPSYYVQKLYSTMMGEYELNVSETGDVDASGIKYCASYDKDSKLYIKLVNTTKEAINLELEFEFDSLLKKGRVCSISGGLLDFNTLEEPEKVAVKEAEFEFAQNMTYELPAESFHVLEIFNRIM